MSWRLVRDGRHIRTSETLPAVFLKVPFLCFPKVNKTCVMSIAHYQDFSNFCRVNILSAVLRPGRKPHLGFSSFGSIISRHFFQGCRHPLCQRGYSVWDTSVIGGLISVSLCVWGWSHQFANLLAPFQNTRSLYTHESSKELLCWLSAFQVEFHRNQ